MLIKIAFEGSGSFWVPLKKSAYSVFDWNCNSANTVGWAGGYRAAVGL